MILASIDARQQLSEQWERGWSILFDTLAQLTDEYLDRRVSIRGVPMEVHAALHRSLAHASYHVGQIVYWARALRGPRGEFLSIPPGGSTAYDADPTRERGEAHASQLRATKKE